MGIFDGVGQALGTGVLGYGKGRISGEQEAWRRLQLQNADEVRRLAVQARTRTGKHEVPLPLKSLYDARTRVLSSPDPNAWKNWVDTGMEDVFNQTNQQFTLGGEDRALATYGLANREEGSDTGDALSQLAAGGGARPGRGGARPGLGGSYVSPAAKRQAAAGTTGLEGVRPSLKKGARPTPSDKDAAITANTLSEKERRDALLPHEEAKFRDDLVGSAFDRDIKMREFNWERAADTFKMWLDRFKALTEKHQGDYREVASLYGKLLDYGGKLQQSGRQMGKELSQFLKMRGSMGMETLNVPVAKMILQQNGYSEPEIQAIIAGAGGQVSTAAPGSAAPPPATGLSNAQIGAKIQASGGPPVLDAVAATDANRMPVGAGLQPAPVQPPAGAPAGPASSAVAPPAGNPQGVGINTPATAPPAHNPHPQGSFEWQAVDLMLNGGKSPQEIIDSFMNAGMPNEAARVKRALDEMIRQQQGGLFAGIPGPSSEEQYIPSPPSPGGMQFGADEWQRYAGYTPGGNVQPQVPTRPITSGPAIPQQQQVIQPPAPPPAPAPAPVQQAAPPPAPAPAPQPAPQPGPNPPLTSFPAEPGAGVHWSPNVFGGPYSEGPSGPVVPTPAPPVSKGEQMALAGGEKALANDPTLSPPKPTAGKPKPDKKQLANIQRLKKLPIAPGVIKFLNKHKLMEDLETVRAVFDFAQEQATVMMREGMNPTRVNNTIFKRLEERLKPGS